MCQLPETVMNSEVDDLPERRDKYIDYALQYACQLWHKHFTNATHIPEITPLLFQFLEKKFLFWLEVLSVLGTARNAVDALEVAAKQLEVC